MFKVTLYTVLALLLFALGASIVSSNASALSPRDGAYSKNVGTEFAGINTQRGKIKLVVANLKFLNNNDRACTPRGTVASRSHVIIRLVPSPPYNVARNGKFSFRARAFGAPRVVVKVVGRFTDSNKAKFKIKARQGDCRASVKVRNARYSRL